MLTIEDNLAKYTQASTREELVMHFSDNICISSTAILRYLNLPKESTLSLWFKSFINKHIEENYFNGLFKLESICYLFVYSAVETHLKNKRQWDVDDKVYNELRDFGPSYFTTQLNLGEKRNDFFFEILAEKAIEIEDNPPENLWQWIDSIFLCYQEYFQKTLKVNRRTYAAYMISILTDLFIQADTFVNNYDRLNET